MLKKDSRMPNLLPKSTFDNFIQTCTPLLKIPELEEVMRQRVKCIAENLLNFQPSVDPIENLKNFLQRDENFIGVVLALANLSQEKFLRIVSAKRFSEGDFGNEWAVDRIYRKMKNDDNFATEIATLFIEGSENLLLSEIVPDFYLDQLTLPREWNTIIRDQKVIGNVVRKKLIGEYSDLKGHYVEQLVKSKVNQIKDNYGITFTQGQVQAMGLGKEVDLVIPSLVDPYILIMVSYMETTSSNQTTRANEQNEMYRKIIGENVRYNTEKIFINIVDGAGWLARRTDLQKIFNGCHYCLNIRTLDQLESIIFKYLPSRFYSIQQPPEIEG